MKKILHVSATYAVLSLVALTHVVYGNAAADLSLESATKAATVEQKSNIEFITKVSEFNKKIAENKLMIIKFGASWCGYCVKVAPVYKDVAQKYAGKVSFYEVDTDASPDISRKCNVRGIPAFKVYRNGEKLAEFTGYKSEKEFSDTLDKFLQ